MKAPSPTRLSAVPLLALLALAPVTLAPRPAAASLVEAMDLAALTTAARRIVVGEVLSVSSAWDAERKRIYTTTVVRVAESWKGPGAPGTQLKVVQLGGSVGDIEMRVHGLSSFEVGERAVLFLGLPPGGDPATAGHYLVGLGQGKRPLRFDAPARRWLVDGGDRSAAFVRGVRGEIQPAASEPALPLDELRTRVRKLVSR